MGILLCAVEVCILLRMADSSDGFASPVFVLAVLMISRLTTGYLFGLIASVLGVVWSFLNPLLTMLVYLFVFSTIFKSNIEYFPVYLMSGIVLFNFFAEF